MGKQNPETRIQNASFLRIGCRQDVLIWRQQVGKYRMLRQPENIVSIGTPGMADSMAVVAVTITPDMVGRTIGVAVAPEFKTPTGRQAQHQKDWQDAFEKRGGVYRLIRSEDEMQQLIEDVQRGDW